MEIVQTAELETIPHAITPQQLPEILARPWDVLMGHWLPGTWRTTDPSGAEETLMKSKPWGCQLCCSTLALPQLTHLPLPLYIMPQNIVAYHHMPQAFLVQCHLLGG